MSDDKVLFLDACSPIVQVGILHKGEWIGYFKSKEEVLQSLFQGVEISLKMAGIKLEETTGFAYCEGPGSLLGVRVAAMAIRGWKELEGCKNKVVYGYNSFEVSLALIRKKYRVECPYYVVSGACKGIWNILGSEFNSNIYEIKEEDLKTINKSLWYFKQKKILIEEKDLNLKYFDYNLEDCAECFEAKGILKIIEEPDALLVREPEYVKWDSRRHPMGDRK